MGSNRSLPWLMCGDFNEILYSFNKQDGFVGSCLIALWMILVLLDLGLLGNEETFLVISIFVFIETIFVTFA